MSSFERRLQQLERRVGHCSVCGDEPIFQILQEDADTGELLPSREDPPCPACGSPCRMVIKVLYDEWPPSGRERSWREKRPPRGFLGGAAPYLVRAGTAQGDSTERSHERII
jgi:hypothetical protein